MYAVDATYPLRQYRELKTAPAHENHVLIHYCCTLATNLAQALQHVHGLSEGWDTEINGGPKRISLFYQYSLSQDSV